MDTEAKTKLWVKTLDGYFKTLAKGYEVEKGAKNKHWRHPTIDYTYKPLVSAITIGWDHSYGCFFYAQDQNGQHIDYHSRVKLPDPLDEKKLTTEEELRAVLDACVSLKSFQALPKSEAGVRFVSHQEQGAGPALEGKLG
ncbi:MAG: hypothetical protein K8H88_16900 [Sandaracinaceae bacterium]|nr:hypothetical protein [Sandaracinaceae bacterium]